MGFHYLPRDWFCLFPASYNPRLCKGPVHIRAEINAHHKPFVFLGSQNSISRDNVSLWFPITICRDLERPIHLSSHCRSWHEAAVGALHSGAGSGTAVAAATVASAFPGCVFLSLLCSRSALIPSLSLALQTTPNVK